MKTKLLYLASVMLVLITSCSVEENTQLSDQEKDQKVKSLVKIFVEDIRPSSDYKKILENRRLLSKTSSGISQEELDKLEQDFLNKQSPEFVELYHYVSSLNLTKEELTDVVVAYINNSNKSNDGSNDDNTDSNGDGDDGDTSSDNDCSSAGDSINNSFFDLIIIVLCEVLS
ncbi:hypothetical protein GCM10009430_39890 [Aquimarina litoralis]|uniref:DUF4296 domain-containing protein n=1 Tax=Aquimarina litoralis TaxID=584605 RepID=A0ABP3UFN2_9FLAO